MNFARTTIIGRLAADAKFFDKKDDKDAMASFRVIVNTRKDETQSFDVQLRGEAAEKTHQYLKKGKEVMVEGNVEADTYPDKDGNAVPYIRLHTWNVNLGADSKGNSDPV